MKAGDLILVRVFPDKEEERVVLEVQSSYVVACRPEVYPLIADQVGIPDSSMGFPLEDVLEVRGQFVLHSAERI